ncbi:ubiquitin carboxyl-terminal hydrolase 8 [Spatholobus suberectus]|nr:ubiquitin carboxyl-terminal hydrolase 8 [Spatholobus suberectus]
MRRQGHYGDPSANTVGGQMHHMAGQRAEAKSGNFEGRLEAFTPERENPYANSKPEGQWRWEMDESNMSNSMTSRMFNEGQGVDASKSYFQGQSRNNNDSRPQVHEEEMDVGYEGNHLSQTFEGLEQNFRDDIIKLTKEQNDAEDAEYARHREKINAINAQYEEKLAALRAQHSSRRAEYLQRESHARQQQYQQIIRDPYPSSGMAPREPHAPRDPHGYNNVNASGAVGEVQRGYSANHFDPYRERARFLGGGRDQGFEPRVPYPGGRVYDTGSRYYN